MSVFTLECDGSNVASLVISHCAPRTTAIIVLENGERIIIRALQSVMDIDATGVKEKEEGNERCQANK